MTEPKKQDGTMELDVGQIDLLDLPLPPRSSPDVAEPRVSKGPPPLPPSSFPPGEPAAAEPNLAEEAAARAFAAEAAFNPLPPPDPPRTQVSARKLVESGKAEGSPIVRFLVGIGGASLLCGALFVGYRMLHKTQPVPAQAIASASASASAAPTQAFTMAPIEFTSTPDDSASAAATSSAPITPPHATHMAPTATAPHGTTGAATPHRTDEVIKVEN